MKTREQQALKVLDDTFGPSAWANGVLSEKLPQVYDKARLDYPDEPDMVLRQVSNTIWYAYSGGDTCYNAGEKIIALWESS